MTAIAAVPADADALPGFHSTTGAHRIDDADDFVTGNARVSDAGKVSFDGQRIRVAHAACLDANSDLARRRRGQFPFHDFEFPGWLT